MATALEQMVDCYSTRTVDTGYHTLDSFAMGPVCQMAGPHDAGMMDFNGMMKPEVYETMHYAFQNDEFLGGGRNTWYQEESTYEPINPYLDGGPVIDFGKSTYNTTIIKEDFGPGKNIYIHHDRGPGRMETNVFGDNIRY